MGTATPSLASTAWTWALSVRAQVDQLGPVADQLAQLSQRAVEPPTPSARRPMRSRSTRSVASRSSFFTRAVTPVVPERVSQVHGASALVDHVGGPVPAHTSLP